MPSSLHAGAATHTPLGLLSTPSWDFSAPPGYIDSHFLKRVGLDTSIRMEMHRDSNSNEMFYAIDDKALVPEQAYLPRMLDTNILSLSVAVTPFGLYSRPVQNEDKNERRKRPIVWQYDGNIADYVLTTGVHEAVVFEGIFDTKAEKALEAIIYPRSEIAVKQRYLADTSFYESLGEERDVAMPSQRKGVLYLDRREARELCSRMHLVLPHHILNVSHDFVYNTLGAFFTQIKAPAIFSAYNPATGRLSYSTSSDTPQARGTAGMRTNTHCNNIHLLGRISAGAELDQRVSESIVAGLNHGGKDAFKYVVNKAKKELKRQPLLAA